MIKYLVGRGGSELACRDKTRAMAICEAREIAGLPLSSIITESRIWDHQDLVDLDLDLDYFLSLFLSLLSSFVSIIL